MIDISEMNKAEVLMKLFNASKAQGCGFLQPHAEPMGIVEAEAQLSRGYYFDYLRGRVMKVGLSGNELDPRRYDRDNGQGAAARALINI